MHQQRDRNNSQSNEQNEKRKKQMGQLFPSAESDYPPADWLLGLIVSARIVKQARSRPLLLLSLSSSFLFPLRS